MPNLSNDITLIIKCCKEDQDQNILEQYIKNISDWDEFRKLVYAHGVFPLVYKTLKSYSQYILQDQLDLMKQTNLNIAQKNMLLTSELIKVMKLLEDNGIEAIAFKGPTLSQMAYGDVVSRQYMDLDVLVKNTSIYKTAQLLSNNKYKTNLEISNLKNSLLIEIGSDFSFFTNNTKVHIELHWNLFRKLISTKKSQKEIWNNKNFIKLNDFQIRTLDMNSYMLYLCVHGSKHLWERIEWTSDIYRLINIYKFDWIQIIQEAKELKLLNMFLIGINLVHDIYNLEIPNELKMCHSRLKYVQNKIIDNYNLNRIHKQTKIIDILNKFYLIALLQDSYYDIAKYFVSSIFKPTHYDIYFFNLDKKYYLFYYLLRPFRFVIKKISKN